MIRLILALATVSVSASAFGATYHDAEYVYTKLSQALPGTVEHTGGLSTEIDLKELICAFNTTKSECTATKRDGTVVTSVGDVSGLMMGLLNWGLAVDQKSEPGTTYISCENLNCARLECKSANPDDCIGVPVEYSCEIN